jgi:hypothetical protein
VWEGEYSVNAVYIYMCENGKMTLAKTISRRTEIKENDRGGQFKYNIFDIL